MAPASSTTRCTRSSRATASRPPSTASSPGLPALLRERQAAQPLLVTTGYELALERALEERDETYDTVCYLAAGAMRGSFCHIEPGGAATVIERPNAYTRELDLDARTVLLHLQGRVDGTTDRAWESFAVTEDDFINYGDVGRRLPVGLAARLRRTHLLLLGYTLSTWTLRVVLERLWGSEPLPYRSWSVNAGPQPLEREFWRRRDVDVVDMAPAAYVAELERALAEAASERRHVTGVPDSPYKGLAAFDDSELDALPLLRTRAGDRTRPSRTSSRAGSRCCTGRAASARARSCARASRSGCGSRASAPVVVHDAWAEDPAGGLIASVREECGELGATAGLVDTVAAAAGSAARSTSCSTSSRSTSSTTATDGPLSTALPELLRRPGLRVNVLIAIRDDALAELDEFTARIPELFANLLRLDRLDRADGPRGDPRAARALQRAERHDVHRGGRARRGGARRGVDGERRRGAVPPARARAALGAGTRRRLADAATRDVPADRRLARRRRRARPERARRSFPRPSRKRRRASCASSSRPRGASSRTRQATSPSTPLSSRQSFAPCSRSSAGGGSCVQSTATPGAAARWEIFHDVLGPPLLAWQQEHQLRDERARAARQRRRLQVIAAASLAGFVLVALLATFALIQRSNAQTQARRAHGRALAARALAELDDESADERRARAPAASSRPAPRRRASSARASRRCARSGSSGSAARSSRPRSRRTGTGFLVASSNGKLESTYPTTDVLHTSCATRAGADHGGVEPRRRRFAAGSSTAKYASGARASRPGHEIRTPLSDHRARLRGQDTLLDRAAATDVRLDDERTGKCEDDRVHGSVEAAALDPSATTVRGRVQARQEHDGRADRRPHRRT